MKRIPVHTRFSLVRSPALALALLFGAMTLPAWTQASPITDLQAQVAALQQTVATLHNTVTSQATQIAALQSLKPLAAVLSYDSVSKTIKVTGVNVQIVNGTGSTSTTNTLGNLIIGYNEDESNARGTCTVSGQYDSFESNCTYDGGAFTRSLSGSHNVVIGSGHGYSSFGGIVVGQDNLITGRFAVVSGGLYNTASGNYSSVSGGTVNSASGINSSISGGEVNTASGGGSSISGGGGNTASYGDSSVSGGSYNTVSSFGSSVSGGKSIVVGGNANGWAAGGANTPAFHSP